MKAILVIDVPNEYKDKDLVIVGDYLRLGYADEYCIKEIEELDTEVLHLKELPQTNELSNVDIEETIKQTKKFYGELSKQLGTNGRYKLLNNGKWLDTKESKQLTHKQFVKQLIKIAKDEK